MKKSKLIALIVALGAAAWWLCSSDTTEQPDMHLTPEGDTTPLWTTRDSVSQLWGCVDERGEWVIPARYDYILNFSCGLAPCYYEGLPAYLATDGTLHHPVDIQADDTYDFGPFYYGYAVITREEQDEEGDLVEHAVLIDTTMHRVLPGEYFGMSAMGDNGLIGVQAESGGLWGYVNRQGETVIRPQYEDAEPFFGGYAPACYEGLFGLIDERGQWMVEPIYEYIWPVAAGRWAAMGAQEEGECLIDARGHVIVPFGRYDDFFGSCDGSGLICAHSREADAYGWLTTEGKEHGVFDFSLVDAYHGGYALGIDILTRDTFSYSIVDTRGVITYTDTVQGYYDDDSRLHHHMLDLRHHLSGYDYAGTLLTLEGDTVHHWVCRQ